MSSQTTTIDPGLGVAVRGAPEVLRDAGRLVSELREVLWAARGGGELMDTAAGIETMKSELDAVMLDVVREIEVRGEAKRMGWASTQDFVTAVAGGHKGSGPAVVRLATTTAEPVFAPIAEAMHDGWLSTAKAHVIQRSVDTLPLDADLRTRGVTFLLGEAKRLDATELRKVARQLAAVVDPDGEDRRAERELAREERAAHLDRYLTITDDLAGGAFLKGRCSAEDAALIKTTLLPLSKPQPSSVPDCDPHSCEVPGCAHDGRDPRDHGARMLDALVESCRRLQTAEVLPDCHGATPRVAITIEYDDLVRGTGFATTDTGELLSPEVARRMACDADLVPVVLGTSSEVLDVGRHQRLATAAIWKALVVRDRHCRFPGCTRPPLMCHAHHLQHWIDGGPTSLENLLLLCGHHHRLVHAGPWTIVTTGKTELRVPPTTWRTTTGRQPTTTARRVSQAPSALQHLTQRRSELLRLAGVPELPTHEAPVVAREGRRLSPELGGQSRAGATG